MLEDYVFSEYVQSFKTASDRTKHALYAVTIACVLIATATWNIRPQGWARQRVERWKKQSISAKTSPAQSDAQQIQPVSISPAQLNGQQKQSGSAQEAPTQKLDGHYAQRVVERMMILDIPALGISLDVNDLGIIGGIALLMLLSLLWLTIGREHENLYLALFKVKQIYDADPGESNNRDGKANLLYHALAMGQVLSRPPTLARWRRSPVMTTMFATLLFLMPAGVQSVIAYTNIISYAELQKSVPPGTLLPDAYLRTQAVIAVFLAILGVLSWFHLRACAIRWRRTFFAINPDWKRRPQRPLWDWLKLPFADHPLQKLRLLFNGQPIDVPDGWVGWVRARETLVEDGWYSRLVIRISLADELFRALRRNAVRNARTQNRRLFCLRNARLCKVDRANGYVTGEAVAETVYRT